MAELRISFSGELVIPLGDLNLNPKIFFTPTKRPKTDEILKSRIRILKSEGQKPLQIQRLLAKEGHTIAISTIYAIKNVDIIDAPAAKDIQGDPGPVGVVESSKPAANLHTPAVLEGKLYHYIEKNKTAQEACDMLQTQGILLSVEEVDRRMKKIKTKFGLD